MDPATGTVGHREGLTQEVRDRGHRAIVAGTPPTARVGARRRIQVVAHRAVRVTVHRRIRAVGRLKIVDRLRIRAAGRRSGCGVQRRRRGSTGIARNSAATRVPPMRASSGTRRSTNVTRLLVASDEQLAWTAIADARRVNATLQERNASVDVIKDEHPYAGGYHALYFRSPDGIKIEIVSPE